MLNLSIWPNSNDTFKRIYYATIVQDRIFFWDGDKGKTLGTVSL